MFLDITYINDLIIYSEQAGFCSISNTYLSVIIVWLHILFVKIMIYALYNDVPQCLFLINLQEEKSRRSFSRAQDILRFIFLYQK